MSSTKTFLTGDKHWALMAIIIILLTTSVGQPIILYIAAMGNIDNSLVEAARVDGATELQVFLKINGWAYCQQPCTLRSLRTINSFQCFLPWSNCWHPVVLTTQRVPLYTTSWKSLYLWIRLCQHHGCLLCGDDCYYQFCAIQDPRNDVEY